MKLKTKIFTFFLIIFWLILFVATKNYDNLAPIKIILFWGTLHIVLDFLEIEIKKGVTESITFSVLFAAIILFGPLTSSLIALFQGANWHKLEDIKKTNLTNWLFNAIQCSTSTLISGIVYKAFGGLIFFQTSNSFAVNNFSSQIIPLLTAIAVYYIINTFLVSIAILLNEGISIKDLWLSTFRWTDLSYLSLGFLGIAFAQLYYQESAALFLLIVPLITSRQSFSRYMQLEQAYTNAVGFFVRGIEAKDRYTGGHSERVAALAEKIGQKLGLAEDEVVNLGRIATLHDIGKIAIPRKILTKPSKLTDEEYLVIQEHPKIGAKVLKDVEFLKDLLPAVAYHHEKFDGSGYGTGLSGVNIPLLARIIAVADTYDAMTSTRAYRDALSHEEAIEELIDKSGIQFDSKIVAALIEVLGVTLNKKQKDRLINGAPA